MPNYFGNVDLSRFSAAKEKPLFNKIRTKAEREEDKLKKQFYRNRVTTASSFDDSKEAEDAFNNASDISTKLSSGKAYLTYTYPKEYKDYIERINNSVLSYGISPEENPFIRFMKNNTDIGGLSGNNKFVDFAAKQIEEDPDLVDDPNNAIYQKEFREKIKDVSDSDSEKFALLVKILSNKRLSSRYFDNLTERKRINLLNKIYTAKDYDEMADIVDKAQARDGKPDKKRSIANTTTSSTSDTRNTESESTLNDLLSNDSFKNTLNTYAKRLGFKGDINNIKLSDVETLFSEKNLDRLSDKDKKNALTLLQTIRGK